MSSIGVRRLAAACASLFAFAVSAHADACPSVSQSIEELVRKAQYNMQQRQFAEAVADLTSAACLAPKDPRILYSLGSSQAAVGDFLSARKTLSALDRLQPGNPLPLMTLARVNVSMGDADGLKATLQAAAARFPANRDLHSTLAQFLLQNKLPDLALAEALRSHKASIDLAVLENTVGAYDDAIRNAIALEAQATLPASVRASAAGIAGLSYESLGQPEAAISHLRHAIQLDPSQENSYLSLAFLLEKTQKFTEAAALLAQGRKNLPRSTALLLPLGSDLILAESYPAGIGVLRDLLQKSPSEYEAYLKLADAFRKTGASDEELKTLRALADRKPDYPEIHLLIARAQLNLDPVDYVKTLEEIALAEPGAEASYLRGRVYIATNRNDEAITALRHAIELQPMDPGAYYQLGRLYQKLGQAQMAKDTFARLQYLKGSNGQ